MDKLALHGGQPAASPAIDLKRFHSKRFSQAECQAALRVIDRGELCRVIGAGPESINFEREFAQAHNSQFAIASSSGSAAIHAALAAVGTGWQDEVITSPLTDIGSIVGIIRQGALPVFADVAPDTLNLTAESVEKVITPRTKAILTVYLAGLVSCAREISSLAGEKGIPLVEDCAQSPLALEDGRLAGTFGQIGCFSLNGFKHISTGEGGMAVCQDEQLATNMRLFTDKFYDRQDGNRNPAEFGMNYRISELQAALGREQLKKLGSIVEKRRAIASRLLSSLAGTPGLILPCVPRGTDPSWWYFILRRDRNVVSLSANELARALEAEGLPAWTGYCGGMPVYLYDCFQNRENSLFELPPLRRADEQRESFAQNVPLARMYPPGLCPVAEAECPEMIILSLSEFYSERELKSICAGIRKVFSYFAN